MSDLKDKLADNWALADEALSADGLDAACIGTAARKAINNKLDGHVLVYSVSKIIEIFVQRDGMEEEEAWEHFHFNVEGGWHGEGTPIWMYDL